MNPMEGVLLLYQCVALGMVGTTDDDVMVIRYSIQSRSTGTCIISIGRSIFNRASCYC